MFCSNCGKEISDNAVSCPDCGEPTKKANEGKKNKALFVVLALFLGGLGIHRFYLGNVGLGILYLVFFWTAIPAIAAFIEAIVIGLRKDDPRFESN